MGSLRACRRYPSCLSDTDIYMTSNTGVKYKCAMGIRLQNYGGIPASKASQIKGFANFFNPSKPRQRDTCTLTASLQCVRCRSVRLNQYLYIYIDI